MADRETLREISERTKRMLEAKPNRGRLTGVARARIVEGVRCEIEEGPWRLAADLPAKIGGDDTAPTPGVLGRSALASCLAMGLTLWSARLGIPVDGVEVEVEADFNARGELGMDPDVPAGFTDVRYAISLTSKADRRDVDALIETAVRHSPLVDVYSRSLPMRRTVRLNGEKN